MAGWSLRTRLVVTTTFLLGVAFLAVGVTTEVTLAKALYGRVDEQLAAAAVRAPRVLEGAAPTVLPLPVHCTEAPPGTPPRLFPAGQVIGTLAARICDGRVLSADVLVERGQNPPALEDVFPTLLSVPVDAPAASYDIKGLGEYRMVARGMPDGSVLITGLPLRDTRETLYLVGAVVAVVTVLALAAVGATGAVTVRRALLPLSQVATAARRVSTLPLDRGEVTLPDRIAEHIDPRTEVGQVGEALNRMLDHVGEALAARHASETRVRQFVADASHELRTPLAAIRGYAELARRSRIPVPDDLAHMLRRVESEAQRMSALVDDLLLLARLDAGRPLDREPVDLSALAVDAVSDAHAAGPDHVWRLDLPDDPVTVTGDVTRLHQVTANLLANARTHTPAGTTVSVRVRATGTHAVLTVLDTGPGIAEGLRPYVFERFARGDSSRSRTAGGTGLGLAIVHAVVTAHRGSVRVRSRPGRTEFTVRLPVAG